VSERTLVLVKPDGVARGLVGEVLARIERKGFRIVAMELRTLSREVAETHYGEHRDKPFFGELVEFITSGPVVMMAVEGEGAIGALRAMMGATDPLKSAPGTIRGDFALEVGQNVIHGSDGPESAARELAIHFTEAEMSSAPAPV
jgi:nucleoside-diphosphate kinase